MCEPPARAGVWSAADRCLSLSGRHLKSPADRNDRSTDPLARIRSGDRRAIARAITTIENGSDDALTLTAALAQAGGHARVIGITGPPGAGKSTLVNVLCKALLASGRSVAVIAVDPSSPISGGAVLGDRVRMGDVQGESRIFIRSLAARGHLGGLTRTTRDVVSVLDAARFDDVIVETVGAGQSEVEIAGIATTRIVVCPPGSGDDIQALKAGILEIADILVVNKADLAGADKTEHELRAMLALRAVGTRTPVVKTVATTGEGVAELIVAIDRHAGAETGATSSQVAHAEARRAPGRVEHAASAAPQQSSTADETALALQRRHAARDRYMAHLGATLIDGGAGRATISMRIGSQHLNFLGGCHGGALFSLADMALGLACNSYGTVAALIDAHMTFPVAVKEGDTLFARAIEITRGRRLATYRMEVSRDDELVSTMTGTVYLTGKEMAPGD